MRPTGLKWAVVLTPVIQEATLHAAKDIPTMDVDQATLEPTHRCRAHSWADWVRGRFFFFSSYWCCSLLEDVCQVLSDYIIYEDRVARSPTRSELRCHVAKGQMAPWNVTFLPDWSIGLGAHLQARTSDPDYRQLLDRRVDLHDLG